MLPGTILTAAMLAADEAAAPSTARLIIAGIVGIATIILLIVWAKLHPFLALLLGSGVLALIAGTGIVSLFSSFSAGLGSTVGGVGVLIALGAIIGKLLIDSGGADQIVDTILGKTKAERIPWAMALIAFIVGIPLFFEVGVVLLIPVVMLVARRAKVNPILVGIPALAGLSALHGLVPPHPGPLIAIDALGANLGDTLGLGLLVAIPVVIVAGPLLAKFLVRWVQLPPPTSVMGITDSVDPNRRKPSFATAISIVLMPVVLMLARAITETFEQQGTSWGKALEFLGTPLVALLLTSLAALFLFGFGVGRTRQQLSDAVGASFIPIAGILLIVGAGGGFKQTLVDSGVGDVIATGIENANLNVLLAGWLVAALIRVATGSATVATTTAAGIMVPLAAGLTPTHSALLVLAIGAGSVVLSHVNDAGFWLVKEYFGMTVGQTFKTWTVMETVASVVAGACVLVLGLVV